VDGRSGDPRGEARRVGQAELPGLLRAVFGDKTTVVALEPVKDGLVNEVYFVSLRHPTREVVVRFGRQGEGLGIRFWDRSFQKEAWLHETLGARGLPVPAVLYLDASRLHVDRDVMILERVRGRSAHEVWDDLAPTARDYVEDQVLDCLSALHRVTTPASGYIGAEGLETPFPSWPAFLADLLECFLGYAGSRGLLDPGQIEKVRGSARDHNREWTPAQPSLLHMDLTKDHVLIDDSHRVVGLLDFANAVFGHAEFELGLLRTQRSPWMFQGREFSRRLLRRMDNPHFLRHVPLFRVWHALDAMVSLHVIGHPGWQAPAGVLLGLTGE
jgi:aminoglycoside phosphotransferase (APT) family kinase protein